MPPYGQIPPEKLGTFGTDSIGHFYEEVRGTLVENADGTDRQKIIEEKVVESCPLLLETAEEGSKSPIKVMIPGGGQIGYLLKSTAEQIIKAKTDGYRYSAFVDEILKWQPLKEHARYGIRALIIRAAPRTPNDEITAYVHHAFGSKGRHVEGILLEALGIAPRQPERPPLATPAIRSLPGLHSSPDVKRAKAHQNGELDRRAILAVAILIVPLVVLILIAYVLLNK